MDELLQEFIAETRETLAALASEIVVWEAAPDDRQRLDAIFRFVHTVKGSCGFLDLPRLAKLSHEAENVLAAVRDGRRTPDARLVDAVLAIVDRIGELAEALDAGVEVEAGADAQLIAALDENFEATEGAPEAVPAAGPVATPSARATQRSVRLPVDLLDRMMNGMSEMVLARNELARKLREGRPDPAAEAALDRLSLTVADMRDTVSRTRMQPIDALFAALPRMVRDTSSQLGKQVALVIEGGDVEIDREMIEAMRDPLAHIVRNAIDHGIEPADKRAAAGKPAAGRLTVAARQSGNTIVIEVSDDGAGIDTARLIAKHAAAHGRPSAEYAGLGERARLDLVFEPGLSSRDEVTQVSGRGVGMDVVRANVEQVGGRIELINDHGRGLAIVIHVPLTLSIIPTIVVGAAGQRFAIARQAVEEIVAVGCDSVRIDRLGGGYIAAVRGERMALVDVPALLGLDDRAPASRKMLAIVGIRGGAYAIAVDEVFDIEELVVRPAAPPVMACGLFAGQTLPDTGVPMLVLDPAGIASASGITFARQSPIDEDVPTEVVATGVECLLVRDLDDVRRAIPLVAVERIEDVPINRIAVSGGRLRLTADGAIIDLFARAKLPIQGSVTVVRLRVGDREAGYAIAEPIEIATLSGDWATADALLGIALHDGNPVEVIDPSQLSPVVVAGQDDRPVCLLAGEARTWMAGFLAPVLEQAGYRTVIEPPTDRSPIAVLAMEDDQVTVPDGSKLVRLAQHPGGNAIFQYDRAGVLAALAGATK